MPTDWSKQTYTEAKGGDYVKEDEWNRLVYTDAVIEITSIRDDDENQYNGKPAPRYLVDFVHPSGETRTKSIAKGNEERNERLEGFRELIEAGETILTTPIKVGKRDDFGAPVEKK